jgi:hypothetical protein
MNDIVNMYNREIYVCFSNVMTLVDLNLDPVLTKTIGIPMGVGETRSKVFKVKSLVGVLAILIKVLSTVIGISTGVNTCIVDPIGSNTIIIIINIMVATTAVMVLGLAGLLC